MGPVAARGVGAPERARVRLALGRQQRARGDLDRDARGGHAAVRRAGRHGAAGDGRGLGSRVDKHRFTADDLRAQIVAACTDDAVRLNIEAIRKTFLAAGGVSRAVEVIKQAAPATDGEGHDGRLAYKV